MEERITSPPAAVMARSGSASALVRSPASWQKRYIVSASTSRLSWGAILFGLPFFLVGIGVLVLGPLDTLRQHLRSGGWEQVPAHLEHVELITHRGSDSTTYQVEAVYRYEYDGRAQLGTRVGYDTSKDNLGKDHQQLASRLRRHQQTGRPVMAWVNPADPTEAYLVRELRWKKLLFMGLFGLLFGGIGGAILFVGVRGTWEVSPGAVEGPILPSERWGHWVWWAFGGCFLAISLPAVLAIPEELSSGNRLILVVLLFPMVGGGLLVKGARAYVGWRRHGPTPLELDPCPGQLGGEVGGRILLDMPLRPDSDYRITLQCLHSRVSGSGKNRSRRESLVWQQEGVPYGHATASGTELRFRFEPPPHLPPSQPTTGDYHLWKVLLSSRDQRVSLERTYTVPVEQGQRRSRVLIPQSFVEREVQASTTRALEKAGAQVGLEQIGDALRIRSGIGRHLGMKLGLLSFGIIFGGASVFLTREAMREGGMLWFMAVVFSLFSIPMCVGGVFTLGRSLSAEIRAGAVRTVRFWFGIPLWGREARLMHAGQFLLKKGSSTSDGREHREYFHLEVTTAGRPVRIAEDILGRAPAEALQEELVRRLRLGEDAR